MKKVIVGISGGVDSAVAAYLLKKEGYDVEGLFMRNWDSTINNERNANFNDICPQEQDYNDALKVCEMLQIPLHRVDFVKEYWDYVFTYFLNELEKGRTPNPDLLCNRFIKFDCFVKEANKLGADFIATGHYAQLTDGKLVKAVDSAKDQTYFLADVKKDQFNNVLFPLGKIKKEEVRKIASDLNLPVASKKDSTGICFIGERNYQKFIANYLKPNPGPIIDIETKQVVGTHIGLMNYTIGQRRNVGISGNKNRHYVCGKNVQENILYIAFGDSKYLYSDTCTISNLNLLVKDLPTECTAKFRYQGKEYSVNLINIGEDKLKVVYKEPVKSVTPGQACVLYKDNECIGCGFIDELYKDGNRMWYI